MRRPKGGKLEPLIRKLEGFFTLCVQLANRQIKFVSSRLHHLIKIRGLGGEDVKPIANKIIDFPVLCYKFVRKQIDYLFSGGLTKEKIKHVTSRASSLSLFYFQLIQKKTGSFSKAIVSHKRILHLARYFGVLAIFCIIGYRFTGLSYPFLVFVGPPIYLTVLLRQHGGFLVQVLPNEPFFNNWFLFAPVTFIYFGLVGFQLKNILNERGRLRIFILTVFLGFLIFVHYFTFQELSLYWEGSEKLFSGS